MPVLHSIKAGLTKGLIQGLPFEKLIPHAHFEPGCSRDCAIVAKRLGMTKVLFVTDSILLKIGVLNAAMESLKEGGIEFVVYDGVLPDPTVEQCVAAGQKYLDEGCNGIIAVGGGSSMDCAKAAGAWVTHDKTPVASLAGAFKLSKPIPPLICIPTTAGTGSEATAGAVVTCTETQRKLLIADFHIFADVALLDPELLLGLPSNQTAATGMDAITHAVESYLSPWATDYSKTHSIEALQVLLGGDLLECFHHGDNLEARQRVLKASFQAGIAINIGGVSMCHALAHNLGANYHTPHGIANAMVMMPLLEFYGKDAHPGLADIARACNIGNKTDKDAVLARKVIDLLYSMHSEMNMPKVCKGLTPGDVPKIAQGAIDECYGTRHSMIFAPSEFWMDVGYPVLKYMTKEEAETLLSSLVDAKNVQVSARL